MLEESDLTITFCIYESNYYTISHQHIRLLFINYNIFKRQHQKRNSDACLIFFRYDYKGIIKTFSMSLIYH